MKLLILFLIFTITKLEKEATNALEKEKYINARNLAYKIIKNNPVSPIGYYVLGMSYKLGEGDLARAYYYLKKAQRNLLFNKKYSNTWKLKILEKLSETAGEMLAKAENQMNKCVREVFEPQYGRRLSDDEVFEISRNLLAYAK